MAPTDSQRLDGVPPVADDRPVPAPGAALVGGDFPLPPADVTAPRPSDREMFERTPAPRRTQPAASVTSEDFSAGNYAESTSYTARNRRPLSGAGYRRSRHQAKQLRRDLRYGQYLEVPKGQRDIFASQHHGMGPAVAFLIAAAIILAVVALIILL